VRNDRQQASDAELGRLFDSMSMRPRFNRREQKPEVGNGLARARVRVILTVNAAFYGIDDLGKPLAGRSFEQH
jgi:hypothetical protein